MLKIRLQGTINDIKWFQKMITEMKQVSKSRVSVKEKLAEMSARLGKDKAGVQKPDIVKCKGKEESL